MTDDKQRAYLIDPMKFAKELAHFSADVPLKFMKRFAEALNQTELTGFVHVELQGYVDFEGTPYIEQHVRGEVGLVCQRCLLPYKREVNTSSKLAPVKSEKAEKKLSPEYDSLMVREEELSIIELVEDELLLDLPLVALHSLEACKIEQKNWVYSEESAQEQEDLKKENPFAKLAGFKIKK